MSEPRDLNAISNDLHAVRKEKLALLRASGEDPYRGSWEQTHVASAVPGLLPEGAEEGPEVSVAGRIVALRVMGKASFVKLLDRSGLVQCYLTRDALGERYDDHFKRLVDLGDFIGVRGRLFRTKTGEVTVRAAAYGLVSKALRPPPEKFHGLADPEQVYRQRYLDLVANPDWSMARWHPQLAASPRPDGMLAMAPASDFEADDRTFVPDWSLHWVRSVQARHA